MPIDPDEYLRRKGNTTRIAAWVLDDLLLNKRTIVENWPLQIGSILNSDRKRSEVKEIKKKVRSRLANEYPDIYKLLEETETTMSWQLK